MSRVFTHTELAAWVASITDSIQATFPVHGELHVTHWYVSMGADEQDEEDRLDVWRAGKQYWCVRWQPDAIGATELPESDDVYHSSADQVLEELADMSNEPDTAWQVWYWHVLYSLNGDLVQLLADVARERDGGAS